MLARIVPVLFFSAGVVIVPLPAVVPVAVAAGAVIDATEGEPDALPFAPPVPDALAVGAIRSSVSGVPEAVASVPPPPPPSAALNE